jgi:hypothetical protein
VEEQSQTIEHADAKPPVDTVRHGDPVPRRRRRIRRPRLIMAATAATILLLAGSWVGTRGWQAAGNLRTAATLVSTLRQQVVAGDIHAARGTLAALRRETSAASDRTDDLGWRAATMLPWVGDDLAATRTIAVTLDDLADNGLPPLLDAAESLSAGGLAPAAGAIDLKVLEKATRSLVDGAEAVRRSKVQIAGIQTAGLTAEVKDAVARLNAGLEKVEGVMEPAVRAATLLPGLLGGDGPRRYLVLFQNLAEVRATGGMPGAFVVVEAHEGAVSIVEQGTASGTLKNFAEPVLPLDPDAEALYTSRLGTYPADINLTPDFPTVARLAREMYRVRSGKLVDGVMATDPVALSYLLRNTGPVPMVAGAPLTADNAVRVLLSQIYAGASTSAQQDAYFASAARAMFDVLTRRPGDPRGLVTHLVKAVDERRLLLWSADPEEQRSIEGTTVEGALPADDGANPTVGVFLNDGSGAKLGYYLTHAVEIATGDCTADDRRELRLKLTLGSAAPSSGLSKSVTGMALSGDPYTVRTNVLVFSPTGGSIADATLDGAPVPLGSGVERGRQVGVATVDLPPGATTTLAVTVITGTLPTADSPVTPVLRTTPGIAPWPTTITPGEPCKK